MIAESATLPRIYLRCVARPCADHVPEPSLAVARCTVRLFFFLKERNWTRSVSRAVSRVPGNHSKIFDDGIVHCALY